MSVRVNLLISEAVREMLDDIRPLPKRALKKVWRDAHKAESARPALLFHGNYLDCRPEPLKRLGLLALSKAECEPRLIKTMVYVPDSQFQLWLDFIISLDINKEDPFDPSGPGTEPYIWGGKPSVSRLASRFLEGLLEGFYEEDKATDVSIPG